MSGTSMLLLLLGVAVAYMWVKGRQSDELWRQAGRSLRLGMTAGGLLGTRRLSGYVDGFKVVVDTQAVQRQGTDASLLATRYRVYYPSLGLGLLLVRDRGGLDRGRQQDIEVGDQPFDQQLVVQGNDPAAVRRFLTPERRFRILRAFKAFRSCRISDLEIRCISHKPDDRPELIRARVRGLVQLATLLAAPPERPAPLEPALVARARGNYARAHRVAKEQPDDDTDARVAEAEILVTSRRLADARRVLASVREKLPDDEHVAELDAAAAEPKDEAPRPAEVAAPAEAAAVDESEDAVAVSTALFAGGLSSVDVERLFAEMYEGRRVRWTGTLEEAEEYMSDFVFGREPGTRAVVKLHEIEQGYFGVHEVRAVLQMPPENAAALRSWQGQAITFTGTLLRVDPFVRNLFVADATVG